MNVKQERHDEAEIQELAAKFVEANKAKMALPQRPPQQPGQSMNILSFLTTDKTKAKTNSASVQPISDGETKNIDEESIKGRFGWTLLGKMHIPYILRSGESYCAVRMVEMKVLNKLLNFLHQDLYNCTNIRSYYITEAEARLLNEINFKHCDYQFGREQFTSRDLIVRLTDANEFYQFLGHCYAKLVNTTDADNLDRCGFIRINRESVVPYTVYNNQKYVPLFYFEGETDNLKQRADKLEGWDLSYLKFCCKVQGIRNELFAHDSCSVISLNDIKNYFPPGTLFEDYWPKKNLDSQLLINNRNPNQQQIVQWTRQPTAPPISAHPPPSPKPATQAKAANNSHMHNVHVYSNYGIAGGQPPYHTAQPRTASSAVRATYPSAAARHIRPYFSNMGQAPPPLVRANSSTFDSDSSLVGAESSPKTENHRRFLLHYTDPFFSARTTAEAEGSTPEPELPSYTYEDYEIPESIESLPNSISSPRIENQGSVNFSEILEPSRFSKQFYDAFNLVSCEDSNHNLYIERNAFESNIDNGGREVDMHVHDSIEPLPNLSISSPRIGNQGSVNSSEILEPSGYSNQFYDPFNLVSCEEPNHNLSIERNKFESNIDNGGGEVDVHVQDSIEPLPNFSIAAPRIGNQGSVNSSEILERSGHSQQLYDPFHLVSREESNRNLFIERNESESNIDNGGGEVDVHVLKSEVEYSDDEFIELAQYNAQTKAASNYMIIEPNINQNNYHQASQSSYPPPLLHMNGGITRYDGPQATRYGGDSIDLAVPTRNSLEAGDHFSTPSTSSGVGERCSPNYQEANPEAPNGEYFKEMQTSYGVNSTSAQLVNQQPAHQATRTQSSSVSEDRSNMTNGRSLLNNVNRNKLSTLPDAPPTSSNSIPYKIQKALVEGKMVPCINMKPNVWTEMLVSLPDLVTNFFNNVPVQSCQQVMQVLGIEIFKANPSQVRLLMENGRCQNVNETIPLVQVRNVIDYMPQLKYMLSSAMLTSDVAAKRQRNS